MSTIVLQFHGELRGFLGRRHASGRIEYDLNRRASIKDIIESFRVPHTEIGAIRSRSLERDFAWIVSPDREVDVFPVVPPLDVTEPSLLRPKPHSEIRFLVDVNVAGLAMLLRALGMDTAFDPCARDAELAAQAKQEERVLLTRDTGLLRRRAVLFGRCIRAHDPDEQLAEVVRFFGLRPPFALFSRCLRCNDPLVAVTKEEVWDRLEPKTKKYFNRFRICPRCHRIYWQGSHHEQLLERLRRVIAT
ncbi:MAG TPA: Mut7-C RNAse domain-containing protein [Desulfomicrobiaceae bacterium]|nr:Mut7-C RNAse domain-containing protein [Desulfomicrobiaceae bacterium]